jgi:hypothetical protein
MRSPSVAESAKRLVLAVPALAGLVCGPAGPSHAGLITLTVDRAGGGDYTSLSTAVTAANADTDLANTYRLLLAGGTYLNDYANVRRPMEIVGAGAGSTILRSTQDLPNQKGIIHTTASLLVKGVTLAGAYIADALGGNGAGIREQMTGAGTLRVEDSVFQGNQMGILTGGSRGQAQVVVSGSQFRENGNASGTTSGFGHSLYVNDAASLEVSDSTFCGEVGPGHNIKSRAARTSIDGVDSYEGVVGGGCDTAGNASRGIDIANGGVVSISDTRLYQGAGSPNYHLMGYASEGMTHPNNSLTMTNVDFVNTNGGTAVGMSWGGGTNPCTLSDVTFSGVSTPVSSAGACREGVIEIPPVIPPIVEVPPEVVIPPVVETPPIIPPVVEVPPAIPPIVEGPAIVPIHEPPTWPMLLAALGGFAVLRHSMRPRS